MASRSVRAFPSSTIDPEFAGMTLRDWFAGQAVAAMESFGTLYEPEAIAQSAYALADAMLAERAKGGDQ